MHGCLSGSHWALTIVRCFRLLRLCAKHTREIRQISLCKKVPSQPHRLSLQSSMFPTTMAAQGLLLVVAHLISNNQPKYVGFWSNKSFLQFLHIIR
jgi:hypothetical protein